MEQEADSDGDGGGGGSDSGRGSADTVVIGAAMTTAVVDRLLLMGLQEDAHAETIVKVLSPSLHMHCSCCKEIVESRL